MMLRTCSQHHSPPPTHQHPPLTTINHIIRFLQELADKVVSVVEPNRERLDAVCVFPSMPAVMKLNKIGSFTMVRHAPREPSPRRCSPGRLAVPPATPACQTRARAA